ncbi:MAG: hypothetical protein LBP53_07435 [Candidatus Peribacteria bacterium]|jgi:DNA polymerase III alpha subunit|nr:hypothetical protein [Candidatus Peribacteria bacterium]
MKQEFIQKGAAFRDYKPETTKEIYERMIEPAASYSFNKSHAVCYALIAYQTAYLKAHYPIEFYAALLRSVEEDTDTQSFYISEIQYHGIEVFPPDVNISFNHVAALDDSIRIGFASIKGVGLDVGETIQQERQKNGTFTSLEDFCKRCGNILNKKSLEGIIKAGALDQFNDRKVLLDNLEGILDWVKNSANADQGLFGGMETSISLKKAVPSSLMERLMMEQEVFKAFISGNPLDGLYTYVKKFSFLSVVKEKTDLKNFIIIGYIKDIQRAKKKGFFIKVEDITENFEFFVADPCGLEKFDLVIIHGYKNERIRISKIIKTSRSTLEALAGSAYRPEETVIQVKKARYGEKKQEDIKKLKEAQNTFAINSTATKPLEDAHNEEANLEEITTEDINEDVNNEEMNSTELSLEEPLEETLAEEVEQAELSDGETTPCDSRIEEKATNELLEHAKEILNEIVDPTIPLVVDASQLKTLEDIHTVVQLIKQHPGDRKAHLLGKDVQLSDEGIQALKTLLGKQDFIG